MKHIIPISGKDSLATALVQTAYEPNHSYEYFVNIVSKELPPFYDWLALAENHLKASIYRIGEDLGKVTKKKGILPNSKTRFCTRLAKIKPMEKWIGDNETIIYYGLRADEQMRVGYQQSKENITAKYPLREHGDRIVGEGHLHHHSGRQHRDACRKRRLHRRLGRRWPVGGAHRALISFGADRR